MSSHGRIPHSGKKVFLHGAFLEIELVEPVDDMQVDNRVKKH